MHQGMFFSILSLLPAILTVADPSPPPSPPAAPSPSSPLENSSTVWSGISPTTPSPIPSPTPTANANKWCIAPIGGFGCSLDCPAFTEKLRLEANFDKEWEKFVDNWRHNVSNQIATCQKVLTPNPDDTDKKVITMMDEFRHMFNCPNRNGMKTVLLEFLKGRNSAHDANDECDDVIGVWRGISKDPKWRQEFDDWRHAYSNAYGKCEERLGQNETDRKTHAAIEVFREWLDCPLESGPNIMTIVAIVFIVAFLLAMAALVAVSLLYIRK